MAMEVKEPEIRFEGFSGEWKKATLASLCANFRSGKFIRSEDINKDGAYPVYGGNGLRGYTSEYNHEGSYALIGRQGALCGNMNFSNGKAFFTEHAIAVKANEKNDTLFLYYKLGLMNLGQYSGQSAQPGLSVNKLSELETFTAGKVEQTAVGNYFQKLDALINQHQQKHDKLSNLKKAMLEKMFPKAGETVPEIRFDGFSGDWVEKSLEEIGYFTSGVGFSEKEQGGKSGIPFYKVSDMNLDGNYYHMNKANNYVDEKQIARLKYKPIRETAILFAKVGAAIFLERKRIANNFLMDNNMMAYIPDEDITFMKQWFDKTKLSGYTKVGALPSFNSSDLGEIRVRVPSYDEQVSIGKYLDSLDKLINQYKQQITKLKNIKQACLDKMFV